VDNSGNAYVTGSTGSSFPTVNALYPTYGGYPYSDAFIFKLSADGSHAVYSTYLGGSGEDAGYGIAVDGSGNAYVTGTTSSSDFPIVNACYPNLSGGKDAFIAKISETDNTQDDYPNKWKPNDCRRAADGGCYCPYGPKDDYGFYVRNCTSFVAWRMNRDRGEGSFTNYMSYNSKKGHWGNASNWRNNAEYLGIPVDHSPSVGAIAHWESGHVAYVESVNGDGTVNISEYNYNNPCAYGERERERADWYIYFNDIIIPDIKANSSDGLVTITTNDTLLVTVSLDCGHHEGQNSDWFIVAGTPFGWFSLTGIGWLHDFSPVYQGKLANVGSVELFNVSGFPSGHYVFYFGIDTKMNGTSDSEAFYLDSVEVNVSP
jgi:hypothetical protein